MPEKDGFLTLVLERFKTIHQALWAGETSFLFKEDNYLKSGAIKEQGIDENDRTFSSITSLVEIVDFASNNPESRVAKAWLWSSLDIQDPNEKINVELFNEIYQWCSEKSAVFNRSSMTNRLTIFSSVFASSANIRLTADKIGEECQKENSRANKIYGALMTKKN